MSSRGLHQATCVLSNCVYEILETGIWHKHRDIKSTLKMICLYKFDNTFCEKNTKQNNKFKMFSSSFFLKKKKGEASNKIISFKTKQYKTR